MMHIFNFTDEEYEQIKKAVRKDPFVGHKFDDEWTDEDWKRLRLQIFNRLGINRNDAPDIAIHDETCDCGGCKSVRKERERMKAR